jgi:cytoskeleton-associated protein 5
VIVVAAAGKCLARLASGMKKRFQPYAGACITCIMEKFREKKQIVVIALREAIDAMFLSVRFSFVFFVIVYFISYLFKSCVIA